MIPKILYVFSLLSLVFGNENSSLYYDSYHGEPITEEEYQQHVVENTTFWCTNVLSTCNPDEWRRVDGSCNNLCHPNRGMPHTPTLRLLPASFSGNVEEGFQIRDSKSGDPLPDERPLRTSLLPEARVPDQVFTQLVAHYLLFSVSDTLSIHDSINFVRWKPYCCLPQGKKDRDCVQVKIPNDDPVHRFSHLRCMKITRPLSYQSEGCLQNDTVPERIISATPSLDLSGLYGADPAKLAEKGRLFKNGLLQYELINGKMWPPNVKSNDTLCILNEPPAETRCHATPEDALNSLPGINLFGIWFWRLHNYIASELAKVNPCWNDDKLFYTARDINIAISLQIYFYELMPSLMGVTNLLRAGVLSPHPGFRDVYNPQHFPQISAEFAYALRWFHIIQENEQKMYDTKGNYLKSMPLTNLTLRTGYLAIDNNLDHITQGAFRQPGGRFESSVDPDIAEIGLSRATEGTDIPTFDLVKNRYFGLGPYVKYLALCSGRKFKKFDDLVGYIKPERLDIIKDKYKNVEDIDLMAGLWTELPAEGSFLPKTLQCIMEEQFIRFIVSDRHWFERPNRPHAFTLKQLLEIRKSTISRLLCDVGDKVTEIQPYGFIRPGPGNKIASCDRIPKIDFRAWKDRSCVSSNYAGNPYARDELSE
ncbi:peroxidase-like [Ostrinia nubilalis]|uniref:peroxidase-like n=1 Tax=Ostrinia nubilalis TaxID=29057 RepID=UPI0030824F8B